MKKNNTPAQSQETATTPKTPKTRKGKPSWTIITALNRVLELSVDSKLTDAFWKSCKAPLDFLTDKLNMTAIQIVALALLVEEGGCMSWRDFSRRLGCTLLTIMTYSEEIDGLVSMRWAIHNKGSHEYDKGIRLERGVVTALRHNRAFVPEKIDGLTTRELIDKLQRYVDKNCDEYSMSMDMPLAEEWFTILCRANPELPLCREALRYSEQPTVVSLFILSVLDYDKFGDDKQGGLTIEDIKSLYEDMYELDGMCKQLTQGNHPLQENNLIEMRCIDGMAVSHVYDLTRHCKDDVLCDFEPSLSCCQKRDLSNHPALTKHTTFSAKTMFYNPAEQRQIEQLTEILSQEQLPHVQERLTQQGFRKGFACLFYGSPGTGKTETVQQIARMTGRDIMRVDIASMRDKFVGESEKNIKKIFLQYRMLSKCCDVTPILLFNEADALINKRIAHIKHSVDRMENAMQNILLQELEEFEGILIATTNLTSNIDGAFDRRFLYKIEFHRPEPEVQACLWRSMLGDSISERDARELAKRFDFSGGQIENIARKSSIHYIITGCSATLDELDAMCRAEVLDSKPMVHALGFRA